MSSRQNPSNYIGYETWFSLSLKDGSMQRINLFPYYLLGWYLGIFKTHLAPGITIGMMADDAITARNQLEFFVDDKISPLKLSKIAGKELLDRLNSLMSEERRKRDWQSTLGVDERTLIWDRLDNFIRVLNAEVAQANVYLVDQQRAWDMTMLIQDGEKALSIDVLNLLPDPTKDRVIKDIRESTKCIAYDVPTAVGFHIYRALEAVVLLYFPVLGVKPEDVDKNKNLGAYTKLLVQQNVNVKVTEMLKHLITHYRNPIVHPDEFWDSEKANSAFGFAVSVMTVMLTDIEDKKKNRVVKP